MHAEHDDITPSSTRKDTLTPAKTGYEVSPALNTSPYSLPIPSYLAANPTITNPLATAAVFYHPESAPASSSAEIPSSDNRTRLLLVQRAPTDFLPLKWELPGGSVDVSDANLVAGVARELREETGLLTRSVVRHVGNREFGEGRDRRWRMVVFEVAARFTFTGPQMQNQYPVIKLDPAEHVRHLWADEDEVRAGRCGDVVLELTDPDLKDIMLRAFALHKQDSQS